MKISEGARIMEEPNITEEQAKIFNDFFDRLSPEEQSNYVILYQNRTSERFKDYLIEFLRETDTTEIRRRLTGKMLPSYS
jgi:hypothetical protein